MRPETASTEPDPLASSRGIFAASVRPWLAPYVLLLGLAAFSGSGEIDGAGIVLVLAILACLLALTALAVRKELVGATAFVVVFTTAYAPRMGDALSFGLPWFGTKLPADAVVTGLALMTLFATIVVAVSASVQGRGWKTLQSADEMLCPFDRALFLSSLGLLLLSGYAAFVTGMWTYYGAIEMAERTGQFRLELLYRPMLLCMFVCAVRELRPEASTAWRVLSWCVLIATAVLLFIAQSRRLIVGAAAAAFLTRAATRRNTPPPAGLGLWTRAALVGAGLAFVQYSSLTWRASVRDLPTMAPSERMVDTSARLLAVSDPSSPSDGPGAVRELESRASYLAVDAAASQITQDGYTLWDALQAQASTAIPGIVFPGKYQVKYVDCETVFYHGAVGPDLACTPPLRQGSCPPDRSACC